MNYRNFQQEPLISFNPDDTIRELLGFSPETLYEKYNLSHNPVDVISFDNIFIETDKTQGMIVKIKKQAKSKGCRSWF